MKERISFELFKSNICHRVKEQGDIDFLIETLEKDMICEYYQRRWYPECLYLLAMVDYISRVNNIPTCSEYNDLRACRLEKTIYPAGVLAVSAAKNDEGIKEKARAEAIPEFMRFNIVENEVRDVI